MNKIMPDLWETEVESPHPGLTTHAYLLVRPEGNVLFYNTGHRHEIEHMAKLGGVAWQFLSHRDELGDTINEIRDRYGAKLGGHVNEKDDFARIRVPDILFDRRDTLLGNVEIIPTPGHTPGSTCFLVHSDIGRRYLFTGDTLYLAADGTFRPGLLSFSNRENLVASLELLATLEPNVALSSAFGGDSGFREVSGRWATHVATALERLRE